MSKNEFIQTMAHQDTLLEQQIKRHCDKLIKAKKIPKNDADLKALAAIMCRCEIRRDDNADIKNLFASRIGVDEDIFISVMKNVDNTINRNFILACKKGNCDEVMRYVKKNMSILNIQRCHEAVNVNSLETIQFLYSVDGVALMPFVLRIIKDTTNVDVLRFLCKNVKHTHETIKAAFDNPIIVGYDDIIENIAKDVSTINDLANVDKIVQMASDEWLSSTFYSTKLYIAKCAIMALKHKKYKFAKQCIKYVLEFDYNFDHIYDFMKFPLSDEIAVMIISIMKLNRANVFALNMMLNNMIHNNSASTLVEVYADSSLHPTVHALKYLTKCKNAPNMKIVFDKILFETPISDIIEHHSTIREILYNNDISLTGHIIMKRLQLKQLNLDGLDKFNLIDSLIENFEFTPLCRFRFMASLGCNVDIYELKEMILLGLLNHPHILKEILRNNDISLTEHIIKLRLYVDYPMNLGGLNKNKLINSIIENWERTPLCKLRLMASLGCNVDLNLIKEIDLKHVLKHRHIIKEILHNNDISLTEYIITLRLGSDYAVNLADLDKNKLIDSLIENWDFTNLCHLRFMIFLGHRVNPNALDNIDFHEILKYPANNKIIKQFFMENFMFIHKLFQSFGIKFATTIAAAGTKATASTSCHKLFDIMFSEYHKKKTQYALKLLIKILDEFPESKVEISSVENLFRSCDLDEHLIKNMLYKMPDASLLSIILKRMQLDYLKKIDDASVTDIIDAMIPFKDITGSRKLLFLYKISIPLKLQKECVDIQKIIENIDNLDDAIKVINTLDINRNDFTFSEGQKYEPHIIKFLRDRFYLPADICCRLYK
jgi:hypothetical protein